MTISDFTPYYIGSFSKEYLNSELTAGKNYISNIDFVGDIFSEGIFYSQERGTWSKIKILNNKIEVEADYLGTRALFYYQGDGICIVSNDISKMLTALKRFNILISPNYISLGTTFAFGGLQVSTTPIKGVNLLPIGEKIIMTNGRLKRDFVNNDGNLISDNTLKYRSSNEIFSNVIALADTYDDRIVLEMTGGIDSRIVFSALIAAGLRSRIDFVTYGGSKHPDRVISEKIASAFDINLIVCPYSEQNLAGSKLLLNGSSLAGVRWLDDVSFRMSDVRDEFIALTGGFGECFRNFYAETINNKFSKSNDFFNQRSSHENLSYFFDIFLKDRIDYLTSPEECKAAVLEQMMSYQGSIGQAFFRQYIEFRNRFHFGGATVRRNSFMKSFDPLYSPSGYLLAKRKDTEYQMFGELSFELIAQFFPPVLSIPFAEKKVAPKFLKSKIGAACIIQPFPMCELIERKPIDNLNPYNFHKEKLDNNIYLSLLDDVLNISHDFIDVPRLHADLSSASGNNLAWRFRPVLPILSFFNLINHF